MCGSTGIADARPALTVIEAAMMARAMHGEAIARPSRRVPFSDVFMTFSIFYHSRTVAHSAALEVFRPGILTSLKIGLDLLPFARTKRSILKGRGDWLTFCVSEERLTAEDVFPCRLLVVLD